jgi:hypothetical protein
VFIEVIEIEPGVLEFCGTIREGADHNFLSEAFVGFRVARTLP